MKILAHKDIFLHFIAQNLSDKALQRDVNKIFRNENSVFLTSKKLLECIKKEISPDDLPLFHRFLTSLIDSDTKLENVKSSEISKNCDEELIHIYTQTADKVVVNIAYAETSTEITHKIPNTTLFSKQQKPNFHWLMTNLVILHPNPVKVNCFDFGNDAQITTFFKDIFKIPKGIAEVYIFDTQCNLDHDIFDGIPSGSMVKYMTINKGRTNNIENKDNIKDKFGRCKMFVTHKDNAHGRRILFENIIVSMDNDFWNLEVNKSDWSVYVQYSESDSEQWISREEKYRLFL